MSSLAPSVAAIPDVRATRARRRNLLLAWTDHEQALGYVLVAPVVLLLLGLVAYPFAVAVGYALSDRTLADPGSFVGLQNFANLIQDDIYRQTVRNTVLYTVGSVTLKILLGLGLALLLNEAIPFRRAIRALVLLPWIVPTVLGTMAWLWMFTPNFSVINWVLVHAGLLREGLPWLTDPDLALVSVMLVNAWRGTPFIAVTVLAGLQSIPTDLYDASAIDGATKWRSFRHITLPLVAPVLLTAVVLSVIWTVSDFAIVYGLTQGGPMNATHVLATYSYRDALSAGNIGEGAAVSLTMLPLLLVLIVWQLRRVRRMTVA
ncbi:MAG: sugar ABC transporter permease [Acidisphaera sp.]|nr:sugar ABC transporter permease [Acidisphaera sp.]